jgi:hypothetical protein
VNERDVEGTVDELLEEPDDETSAGAILVMAKAGLLSPESPNKTIR